MDDYVFVVLVGVFGAEARDFACVLACWAHRTDGTIPTPETDQASGWRPPALAQRNDDGGWD